MSLNSIVPKSWRSVLHWRPCVNHKQWSSWAWSMIAFVGISSASENLDAATLQKVSWALTPISSMATIRLMKSESRWCRRGKRRKMATRSKFCSSERLWGTHRVLVLEIRSFCSSNSSEVQRRSALVEYKFPDFRQCTLFLLTPLLYCAL